VCLLIPVRCQGQQDNGTELELASSQACRGSPTLSSSMPDPVIIRYANQAVGFRIMAYGLR
jgi:hypothetical protein